MYILASSIYLQVDDGMQVITVHKPVGGSHVTMVGGGKDHEWMMKIGRRSSHKGMKGGEHERKVGLVI